MASPGCSGATAAALHLASAAARSRSAALSPTFPLLPCRQVESELEEFGDIVFVREKTNYKSILFKTFYVSGGRRPETGGRPVGSRTAAGGVMLRLHAGARLGPTLDIRHRLQTSCGMLAKATAAAAAAAAAAVADVLPPCRFLLAPRQVMEYAVTHYDVAFVLKTDDDAFINVAPMVEQLKLLCQNPGCQK